MGNARLRERRFPLAGLALRRLPARAASDEDEVFGNTAVFDVRSTAIALVGGCARLCAHTSESAEDDRPELPRQRRDFDVDMRLGAVAAVANSSQLVSRI